MRVGVLGTNFKVASLDVREALSLACHRRLSTLSGMARDYACVVLSTCNRVEIYFSASDLADAHSTLLQVLHEEILLPFEHQLYSFFGQDCLRHLSQVTAGLDSAIVAESEIQRQVKSTYEGVLLHYPLPSAMHYLFQKAFQMGKFIRSHFSLALNEVTIPKLLFEMSGTHESVLFVGNSEINRQIIAYFKQKGCTDLTLCSRSLYAAQDVGVPLIAWEALSSWHRYSLVICGSNSPHYVITETQEKVITEQIFDLSMPRTVDPVIAHIPSLRLVNMQELIATLQQRQQCNERAMGEATQAIYERSERLFNQFLLKEGRERLCV